MLSKFTNQYSLSKTLRFELKPVGETADYIEDFKSQQLKDFVEIDQQRASDYLEIKKIIDDYHRDYIENSLSSNVNAETGEMIISFDDFNQAFDAYKKYKSNSKDKSRTKVWEDIQKELRKKLVSLFPNKANLFKKELITKDIPAFLKKKGEWDKNKAVVETFNKFTTYFKGFHENRQNMYSEKDQSTAISYRLMNENLPRFFDNCICYAKIIDKYKDLDLSLEQILLDKTNITSVAEIFKPHYYINLFTQTGIDNYQLILVGFTTDDGTKIQGLNEKINQFKQKLVQSIKDDAKAKGEKNKGKVYDLSGFTELYKQILSDRETASFIPEAFEDDRQLLESLSEFIKLAIGKKGLINQLQVAVEKLNTANLEKTYIKSAGLSSISQSLFKSYNIISQAIKHFTDNELKTKKQKEDYQKQKTYTLKELDENLYQFIKTLDEDNPIVIKYKEFTNPKQIISSSLKQIVQNTEKENKLQDTINNVQDILNLTELSKRRRAPNPEKVEDTGGKGFVQIQKIQTMLDAFMSISHALKPLHLVDGRKPINLPDKDNSFYSEFVVAYEEYANITIALYNKVRNHLTKKSFSKDKIKLNFDKGNFLNGFVESKTENSYNGTQYGGYLLRKQRLDGEYNYYLGISKKSNIFSFYDTDSKKDSDFERLNYYQAKTNSIYGSSYVGNYQVDKEDLVQSILNYVERQTKQSDFIVDLESAEDKNFKVEFLNEYNELKDEEKTPTRLLSMLEDKSHLDIPVLMESEEVKKANAKIIKNLQLTLETYKNKVEALYLLSNKKFDGLKELQDEISKAALNKSFIYQNICEDEMQVHLNNDDLFLFQIYNKDFSENRLKKRKRTDNLHTMYFKALMEGNNDCFDIGSGEVFFRKHSIPKHITHPRNLAIKNKNENNPKQKSSFTYDLIKDKRYTHDKFLFHLSVDINYKQEKPNKAFTIKHNNKINAELAEQDETCVIGIDRGERHLLYYAVINSQGKIIEQGSLNSISTDQGYKVDYQQKLHQKEKQRDKARKSWSSVENIKELKAGYLSHVIHKLALLIEKHNAIVCLEDLNFGFKRGRFKVEKQVYQKFEKALIDKLNYLVFKNKQAKEVGGNLNAYQLTAPFESFKQLEKQKQSGILFYVRADYTSKIDPATGFIDFLRPRYVSLAKSKAFFENIECFKYNANKGYFEMLFDYKKMKPSLKIKGYQSKWTVCTFGDVRYQNKRNDKGEWETESINVTHKLKQLLELANIQYKNGQDLKQELILKKETKFYKTLFWLLKLTLSLRHSKTGTDDDFILSPVANEKGQFYDSRNASSDMPKDADANGAYNIALKGLWNIQQIKAHDWNVEKPKTLKLNMSNEQWFEFAGSSPLR